jgi:hypothetical protein
VIRESVFLGYEVLDESVTSLTTRAVSPFPQQAVCSFGSLRDGEWVIVLLHGFFWLFEVVPAAVLLPTLPLPAVFLSSVGMEARAVGGHFRDLDGVGHYIASADATVCKLDHASWLLLQEANVCVLRPGCVFPAPLPARDQWAAFFDGVAATSSVGVSFPSASLFGTKKDVAANAGIVGGAGYAGGAGNVGGVGNAGGTGSAGTSGNSFSVPVPQLLYQPTKGQSPMSSFNLLPEFVANLTTHEDLRLICNVTLQSVVENVYLLWSGPNVIAFSPFKILWMVKSRSFGTEKDIGNFVALSHFNGLQRAEARYDEYAQLKVEYDLEKNEQKLAALWKRDLVFLDQNDVEKWMLALRNWVQFWDMIISFKDSIRVALDDACARFETLIRQYDFGADSLETQVALKMGCYYFTKQVMEALQHGKKSTEEAVSRLELLPRHSQGSPLGDMLSGCMQAHFAKAQARFVFPSGAQVSMKKAVKGEETAKPKGGNKGGSGGQAGNATSKVIPQGTKNDSDDKICHNYISAKGCSRPSCNYFHRLPQSTVGCQFVMDSVKRIYPNLTDGFLSANFRKKCAEFGVSTN